MHKLNKWLQCSIVVVLFFLFSGCDGLQWNSNVESFVENGLTALTLKETVFSGTGEPVDFIPSGDNTTIQLNMINPRQLDAVYTLTALQDDLLESDFIFDTSQGANKKLTLTLNPDIAAEHETLDFQLGIYVPSSDRIYEPVQFSINCDSPPNPIDVVEIGSTTQGNKAVIAFALPAGTIDDDLYQIQIDYNIRGHEEDIQTYILSVDDENYSRFSQPCDLTLDNSSGRVRYFSPPDVVEGQAYDFSVRLIDKVGLISDAIRSSSDLGILSLTFNLDGTGGNTLDFGMDSVMLTKGETLTFTPGSDDLAQLTGWTWTLDGVSAAGSSSYSYTSTDIGQHSLSCSVTYQGILYSGSILLTLADQPAISYCANGGKGRLPSSQKALAGSEVILSSFGSIPLVRDGYITDQHWNSKADGSGISYAPGDSFTMGEGSTILYAQWTVDTRSLTLKPNFEGTSDYSTEIQSGASVILYDTPFTRTDHSLAGWAESAGGKLLYTESSDRVLLRSDGSPLKMNNPMTLYALWKYESDLSDISSYRDTVDIKDKVAQPLIAGYLPAYDGDVYRETLADGSSTFTHFISPFYMGKYEVTYELWYTVRSWAQLNGYTFANPGQEGGDLGYTPGKTPQGHEQPVSSINQRDALIWCNAYSEMAGLTPCYYTDETLSQPLKTSSASNLMSSLQEADIDYRSVDWDANGYRLPTPGEWQYAASSGGQFLDFASGTDTDSDELGECAVSGAVKSSNVATKKPNALGLYDMSGNMQEWCFGWYYSSYTSTQSQINYSGVEPLPGQNGPQYIYKGGGYIDTTFLLYKKMLGMAYYMASSKTLGFRICRSNIND